MGGRGDLGFIFVIEKTRDWSCLRYNKSFAQDQQSSFSDLVRCSPVRRTCRTDKNQRKSFLLLNILQSFFLAF